MKTNFSHKITPKLMPELGERGAVARSAMLAFATLVVIAIAWNILGPVLDTHIFSFAEDQVAENMQPTYQLIRVVWRWWPIILLVAVIVYLFMQAQEPHRGVVR